VVAVLKGRELYVANAGDSRAVLGRGATAVPLSEDHKPASASEKQRITDAGGFVSEVQRITVMTTPSCIRRDGLLPLNPMASLVPILWLLRV